MQISIIDDSSFQLENLEIFIQAAVHGELKISKFQNFEEVMEGLEFIINSDFIFCDYIFEDMNYTGEDILKEIFRYENCNAKAYILTGDSFATVEDARFEQLSKFDIQEPLFFDKLFDER